MIIFTDLNKTLANKVKKLVKETTNNLHTEIIVENKDILKVKKAYPNALIATASNPDFTMGGGLDAIIKKEYKEQCISPKEFKFTKDLFFTVTCDKDIKTNKNIIKRALLGVYLASRKNDIILTGLGTSIAKLSIKDFLLEEFRLFLIADFSNAYFRDANFRDADFSNADFRYANFSNTDFRDANFRYANFSNTSFRYSNFVSSNFISSDFRGSDFRYSNFSNSNFSNFDFRGSNFNGANFSNSDFSNANFSNANFRYSDFRYSDFSNSVFNYRIIPEEGKFIGWKKANNHIVKLEIQDAKNVSGGLVSRKLRTDKVKVLGIYDNKLKLCKDKSIISDFDNKFIYTVDKIKTVKEFKKDDKIECATGIHFFITKQEAINY